MLWKPRWRHVLICGTFLWAFLEINCSNTFAQPLQKKWQIHVIHYTELSFLDQTLHNVKRGLLSAGFEEGRHYDITVRSAQGDIATVIQLLDAARDAGADVLIPLQSITLQAAIHRTKNIPILFDVVADPFLLGAGTTDEDHLPNVTGVYSIFATDQMIQLIRLCSPRVTSIGVVFNPSEPQSAAYKDKLIQAAADMDISVKTIGINTVAEVPDASLALTALDIHAILIIGMIPSLAFPTIHQSASRQRLPVFDYYDPNAAQGAVAVLSMNFPGGDTPLTNMLVKILQGTSPANIPFHRIKKYRLIVNPKAAQQARSFIPMSVLQKADEVIQP
ncbi:MAG: ABC transporter substrate-binding protein [Ignavibacteria bacterium]|nr:ABC transporter substrate-binding protein [Ignavibacteria bacterium]